MAIGLTIVATSDLVLEIGHNLCHVEDYIAGNKGFHTHKIGNHTSIGHEHVVLQKVDDLLAEIGKENSPKDNQIAQVLSFDNLKLIIQGESKTFSIQSFSSEYYHSQLKYSQNFSKITSPPPQGL